MTTGVQGRPTREYVDYQVTYFTAQITFEDTASGAVEIGWMPAGAIVTNVRAEVVTAFDDTTTDVVSVGISSDPDRLAASLDVSAAGTAFDATTLDAAVKSFNTDQLLVAQYAGGTGDASAGVAYVIVEYVVDSDVAAS